MAKMAPDDSAKEQQPSRVMILVLGMHRSGTSALSGVLNKLGCAVPKTPMPAGENNPKGYFESDLIHHFNDDLLLKIGSNWQDWQPLNPDWMLSPVGKAFLPRARDLLVEEFGDEPLVVFKDPRVCRMVPFWRDAAEMAGLNVLPVLTHRNPFEVAKSLYRRNKIDTAESLAIWLRHVLDAEASTRQDTRFFASYDRLLANWPAQLNRMQDALGIVFPRSDARSSALIDDFLSPQLQHFTETPEKISENRTLSIWVRETYEILERWAETGEAEVDYKKLDHIRRGFDDAAPLFSQLTGPDSGLAKDLQARIATLQSEQQTLETKLAELDVVRTQAEKAQTQIKENDAQRAKLQAELAELQKLATDHEAARTDLKLELEQRQVQAAAQKSEHEATRQTLIAAEEQLSQSNTDLTEAKDRLSQTQSALAQRRLEAEETGQRADKLEQAQTQAKAQITRLEADAEKHLRENAELTRLLQQSEAEASQYLVQIEELSTDLETRKQELSESAQLVVKSESALSKASGENAKLCARQNTQVKELSDLARFLTDAETALAQTSQKVVSLEQDRQNQSKALAAEQAQSAAAKAESAALKERVQALEDEMTSFKRSTFWRLTKPLRAVVDTVRRQR